MARKEFSSIPVERPQLELLQAAKEDLQQRAGRSLRWGDVFTALLAFKDQVVASADSVEGTWVEMGQDDDRALTPEELEAMGIEQFPGLPMTLSDADHHRIADLVVEKLMERLPGLLGVDKEGRP